MNIDYINLAVNINNNLDDILKLSHIKNIIDNSENIIHRYSIIWSELNYKQVVSCYIALLYYIYNNMASYNNI